MSITGSLYAISITICFLNVSMYVFMYGWMDGWICTHVCMANRYFSNNEVQQKYTISHAYTAYAVVLTNYCLNHCARTCCSLRIVTRCHFMNWPISCEWGGRNLHFLSINLIGFCRSRGILFWLWLSRRGRWKAPVDSEIQRKMWKMLGISVLKGYQVEALEAVCLNKRDMPVWASSLVHSVCDWPDSYRFEKRPLVMLQCSQISSNTVAVQ